MTARMIRFGILGLCTLGAALSLAGCPTTEPDPEPVFVTTFSDDFSATSLQSGWTVDRPNDANRSLTARSGFLRIITEAGSFNGDNNTDTAKNLVLRQITGDFQITCRVEFAAEADRQLAGILVRSAEGTDVIFGLTRETGDTGPVGLVVALAEQIDGADPLTTGTLYSFSDVYLRLQRSGDTFTAFTSRTGEAFAQVGSSTISSDLPDTVLVGVTAGTGPACDANCDAATAADFDSFEIAVPE